MAGKKTNHTGGGGQTAAAGDRTLRTYAVGAMPIVGRVLQRMKLEQLCGEYLQPDGARMQVPTPQAVEHECVKFEHSEEY